MLNYLSKFIPNYSQLTVPLRNLIKNETEWQWSKMHSETLALLKEKVAQAPVLKVLTVN